MASVQYSFIGLTVADTVEVYILAEEPQAEEPNETTNGLLTLKVQGKGGQRDVVNIQLAPDENMG